MAPTPSSSKAAARQTTQPANVASNQDESRYLAKYKALKEKVSGVEHDNVDLQTEILKSKRQIQRLRIERAILYERLHASRPEPATEEPASAQPHQSNAHQGADVDSKPVENGNAAPVPASAEAEAAPQGQGEAPQPSRASPGSIPNLLNPTPSEPSAPVQEVQGAPADQSVPAPEQAVPATQVPGAADAPSTAMQIESDSQG